MPVSSIGDALFTKTQQKVLGILFGKPDRSFYTNELVRMADMGRGTVCRELERLAAAGILGLSIIGNQHHYRANPESPVYAELVSIVRKTFGVADIIREALLSIEASVKLAFIYGSTARGHDSHDSDIDLMLVGDDLAYGKVVELLLPVSADLGRDINPVIYSRQDFKEKLAAGEHFLQRVMEQERIMIKGTLHDTGEPGTN